MKRSGRGSPEAIRRAQKKWNASDRAGPVRRINYTRKALAATTDPARIEELTFALAFHRAELAKIEANQHQRQERACWSSHASATRRS